MPAEGPVAAQRRRAALWAGVLASLGVVDWLLDRRHDGSTLSEATRWVFGADTPRGRVAFLVAWGVASGVFAWHIVRSVEPRR